MPNIKKLDIALEFLDLAMQLYMEGRNYLCAIHLAGAAEELLGMHRLKAERISELTLKAQKGLQYIETGKLPKDAEARKIVNLSKNSIKHMRDNTDDTIDIDPSAEARRWIEDALINLEKLELKKSITMWKFEDYTNEQDHYNN